MAPETLQDIKTFSHASDVWSFGILVGMWWCEWQSLSPSLLTAPCPPGTQMWEIAALGNNPYPALSNSEVANHVIEGGKIVSPKHAPDGLYVAALPACRWAPRSLPPPLHSVK